MEERSAPSISGWVMLVVVLVLLAVAGWSGYQISLGEDQVLWGWGAGVAVVLFLVLVSGFVVNPPNLSRVITFVGRYVGTVRRNGFSWTFRSPVGNGSVCEFRTSIRDPQGQRCQRQPGRGGRGGVWHVLDTAKAAFEVQDYEEFVKIQTETAVRHMASALPVRRLPGGRALAAGQRRRGHRLAAPRAAGPVARSPVSR